MSKIVTIVLRVLIVLFFLITLLGQFFVIPGVINDIRQWAPEFGHLAIPYGGAAFLALICVEVVLAAIWILLGMVRSDVVFTERAFRWVNVIIWATWIAVGMTLIPLLTMLFDSSGTAGSPPAFLFVLLAFFGGTAFALLMTVMRALLRQATDARAELAEVI